MSDSEDDYQEDSASEDEYEEEKEVNEFNS
jgi:hypothetical protein